MPTHSDFAPESAFSATRISPGACDKYKGAFRRHIKKGVGVVRRARGLAQMTARSDAFASFGSVGTLRSKGNPRTRALDPRENRAASGQQRRNA